MRTRIACGSRDCLGRRSGRGGNDVLLPPFAVFGECCLRSCLADVGSVVSRPPTDSGLPSCVAEGGLRSTDNIMRSIQKGAKKKSNKKMLQNNTAWGQTEDAKKMNKLEQKPINQLLNVGALPSYMLVLLSQSDTL